MTPSEYFGKLIGVCIVGAIAIWILVELVNVLVR